MERISGKSGKQLVEERQYLTGRELFAFAQQFMLECALVQEAGYCIRDCNLGNVILEPNGVLRLIDFGWACHIDELPSCHDGLTNGVEPPEARIGDWCLASDVYEVAMCVIFVAGLRGREFIPRSRFGVWLLRCTEPEPADRFEDCRAAHNALRCLLDE